MPIGTKSQVTPDSGLLIYHDGEFDLDGLYETVKAWFNKKKYDYTEKDHQVKHKKQGREVAYIFEGERKIDELLKFTINCNFLATRVRLLKNGNYQGLVKINTRAWIDIDYDKRWQKSAFNKFIFYIYINYIIKDRLQRTYEAKLYLELLELINVLKKTMKNYG